MSFFISDAMAEGAAGGDPTIAGFIPIILIFILFYFLLIRPQAKKAKEHKGMVASLGKGDEVVTNSGILGKIEKVEPEFLVVEVSDTVTLKFQRSAVHAVLPKGTIKAIS